MTHLISSHYALRPSPTPTPAQIEAARQAAYDQELKQLAVNEDLRRRLMSSGMSADKVIRILQSAKRTSLQIALPLPATSSVDQAPALQLAASYAPSDQSLSNAYDDPSLTVTQSGSRTEISKSVPVVVSMKFLRPVTTSATASASLSILPEESTADNCEANFGPRSPLLDAKETEP